MPYQGNPIGTLVKPHGYKGEMHLKGTSDKIEILEEGMPVFIQLDGQRIPFFIEYFDPDLSGEKGIIKLEFINSDSEARRFTGCPVFSELHLHEETRDSSKLERYVGFTITDSISGIDFTVTGFLDYPDNPLLILEKDQQEVMVPIQSDFFQQGKIKGKKMTLKLPDGLLS